MLDDQDPPGQLDDAIAEDELAGDEVVADDEVAGDRRAVPPEKMPSGAMPVGAGPVGAGPVDAGPAGAPVAIAQAEFRTVLGHFASGVVVVTAATETGPGGFTCQSFFSLSLDPPLVAFAPGVRSASWPGVGASGSCTVNVLSEEQEALARAFARSGTDKFAGVGWTPGATGAPRLHDALAWLDCRIEQVLDGGDHHIVVARVVELAARRGDPLLFYRGGFGTFRV